MESSTQRKRVANMRARARERQSKPNRNRNTNTQSSSSNSGNNEMKQMRINTRATNNLHNIFRRSKPSELILYNGNKMWTFRKMNTSQGNATNYKYFKNNRLRNISFSYVNGNSPYIYLNSLYVNEPKQPGNIPAAAVRNVLKRLAPSVHLQNASTYVLNKNRNIPRYLLPPEYDIYSGAKPNYDNIKEIAEVRRLIAKDLDDGLTLHEIYNKYQYNFGLMKRIYRTFGKALPRYEKKMVAPV